MLGYMKQRDVRFIEVETKDKTDEENENDQVVAIVFDLEEEKSK